MIVAGAKSDQERYFTLARINIRRISPLYSHSLECTQLAAERTEIFCIDFSTLFAHTACEADVLTITSSKRVGKKGKCECNTESH